MAEIRAESYFSIARWSIFIMKKIIKYQNACGSVLQGRVEPFPQARFLPLVYSHSKQKHSIVGKHITERSKFKLSMLILDYTYD